MTYRKDQYIETASGNKLSRESVLFGVQNIVLSGKTLVKPGAVLRGDLAAVRMGRFCVVESGAVLRPSRKTTSAGLSFFPLIIGSHVSIGEGAVIEAAQIGSFVKIGAGAVIGRRAILLDCCAVAPGAIVPADTVIPPLTYYSGSPAKHTDDLPEATRELVKSSAVDNYNSFVGVE